MKNKLPFSREAEQAVLSGIIFDPQSLTSIDDLSADEFYHGAHRLMFSAMRGLEASGKPIDLVSLVDHLQATGDLDRAGGPAAVSALAGAGTAAGIQHWSGMVKEKAALRAVIAEATAIAAEASQEPEDVDAFMDRAQGRILALSANGHRRYQAVAEIMPPVLEEIERAGERGGPPGLPSGFPDLDRLTAGFQPGQLAIMAGRPSQGKTALALGMACHAALESGASVAFFSLEMSGGELVRRLLSIRSVVKLEKIQRGIMRADVNTWKRVKTAADDLASHSLVIDDSPTLSLLSLRARARRIKAERGLSLMILDYLQLLDSERRKGESRNEVVAEMSRGLKGLARELNVPVLILSQLNRKAEDREEGEPRISDLRDSGAIEQDADLVMLIHRPGVRDKGKTNPAKTILHLAKNRNGATGEIELTFIPERACFESKGTP
jgi:replicative DNA helicase